MENSFSEFDISDLEVNYFSDPVKSLNDKFGALVEALLVLLEVKLRIARCDPIVSPQALLHVSPNGCDIDDMIAICGKSFGIC